MSKELTERLRNGTLPLGKMFWCSDEEGNIAKLIHIRGEFFEWTISENNATKEVAEVLAPVPNYEEYQALLSDSLAKNEENAEMKQKIHILTESQMNLENAIGSQADFFRQKISVLESQLSSISEQLKEANEVIKWYATGDLSDWEYIDGEEVFVEKSVANETDTAEKYLTKYGVEK